MKLAEAHQQLLELRPGRNGGGATRVLHNQGATCSTALNVSATLLSEQAKKSKVPISRSGGAMEEHRRTG